MTKDTNILAAKRQHHRLVRRYHSRGADAFCRAITLIDRWHRSHGLPAVHSLQHTLRRKHTQLKTPASPTAADLQAALYPPAVRLAYLIATPDWLAHATHDLPSWNRAADHVARHITGGYRPIGINRDVFEHIQQEFNRWPIQSERIARQDDPERFAKGHAVRAEKPVLTDAQVADDVIRTNTGQPHRGELLVIG